MKIVIDARNMNSSTGRYAERLVHHLEEIDTINEYVVVLPSKDKAYYMPRRKNFSVALSDCPWYSFAEQTSFRRFLYDLKPDLVHFCMPHQPVRFKVPFVTTVHDLILLHTYNSDKNFFIFKAKQFVGRFVFKSIAKTAAHIICPSKFIKEDYANFAHIDPRAITVTYEAPGVSDVAAQEYPPLKTARFLLYVGQQSDYKNIRRLMQAHQLLRRSYPDLQLVFIGRTTGKNAPPLLANKEWASRQGYEGVVYTGFLPDGQMRWCMEHCAAYVFPSLMEGFGLPGLDALATGAPLVSSNAACLPEIYGDAAEYFNPYDTAQMAEAIERVLQNPDRRRELIAKGHARAALYSWRRMAEQTHAIYQTVLAQRT